MRSRKQMFVNFVTEYIGERVGSYEEFVEFLYEEVLKKDGYENTIQLLLEILEDYLRHEDEEDEDSEVEEW